MLQQGLDIILQCAKTLGREPGVYRMLSAKGDVLYVGKAKHLKNRVLSYTRANGLNNRLSRMVSETTSMEFVTTDSEAEALLLEANLIKKYQPRYNILLRDDKSFPFIHIAMNHDFPRLRKHRGAKNKDDLYFGPFASTHAVSHALIELQKAFLLRTCSDTVFNARSRPCLLYHIKRCAAPCVDNIKATEYKQLVRELKALMSGKNTELQKQLTQQMLEASESHAYERAAQYRDRLRAITRLTESQKINVVGVDDVDVFGAHTEKQQVCIQVFFFRSGQNCGSQSYFPSQVAEQETSEVLSSFLAQFYAERPAPGELYVSVVPQDMDLLVQALSLERQQKVSIIQPKRGPKKAIVDQAVMNARDALSRRMSARSTKVSLLQDVAHFFGVDQTIKRIEVYDNSHIQGSSPVGAMVVASPEGFEKNQYRKFNIRSKTMVAGDDYGMLREVMTRRFERALKENQEDTEQWPDIVLIDGGKGHLSTVQSVFDDLGITSVLPVAIAKGPRRDAGEEAFYFPDGRAFCFLKTDPVAYYLQTLRDEVHRFAIGTHRAKRAEGIRKSVLEGIPGIGAKRKKALILHFGSARDVSGASIEELMKVEGVSASVAQTIYDYFH